MENSIVLSFFIFLYDSLYNLYRNSILSRVADSCLNGAVNAISGSAVLGFFGRDERTSSIWQNSLFYRMVNSIITCIISGFRFIYDISSNLFENSFIISAIKSSVFIKPRTFIYLTIIAIPLAPGNTHIMGLILLTAVVFALEVIADKSRYVDLKSIDLGLVLFMLFLALAALGSNTPAGSFKTLVFYMAALLFVLILVSHINSRAELNNVLAAALVSSIIPSVYGLYQHVTKVAIDPEFVDISLNQGMPGRVFSTMENPNNFAEYLILVIPLCIALFLNVKGVFRKLAVAVLSIPAIACLGFTYSRSGWLAIAFGIMVFVFLKNWRLIPVIAILGILSLFFLPQSIMNRIMTIGNLNDTSASYRLFIWNGALGMLKDFWLTGIGLGPVPFVSIYQGYMPEEVSRAAHSHNLFLETWLELGLAGFLSFLWFAARLFKKSVKSIFSCRLVHLNNMTVASISALSAFLVMGVFEYVWFYPKVMVEFWFVVGTLLAALKLYPENADNI